MAVTVSRRRRPAQRVAPDISVIPTGRRGGASPNEVVCRPPAGPPLHVGAASRRSDPASGARTHARSAGVDRGERCQLGAAEVARCFAPPSTHSSPRGTERNAIANLRLAQRRRDDAVLETPENAIAPVHDVVHEARATSRGAPSETTLPKTRLPTCAGRGPSRSDWPSFPSRESGPSFLHGGNAQGERVEDCGADHAGKRAACCGAERGHQRSVLSRSDDNVLELVTVCSPSLH
jgi:hypothetical protein